MTTVTIRDVRYFLKNLPEDFVSDETITIQIDMAEWIVGKEKSAAATADDLYRAELICTAYRVTVAYMEEAERAIGVIPPSLAVLITQLQMDMELALSYIKRGNPVSISVFDISDSIWDYRGGGTIRDASSVA